MRDGFSGLSVSAPVSSFVGVAANDVNQLSEFQSEKKKRGIDHVSYNLGVRSHGSLSLPLKSSHLSMLG